MKQTGDLTGSGIGDQSIWGRKFDWLVGCFGFYGPLRQYFSLYRAVSQGGRKKLEKIDERKKCPNNPNLHLLQAQ